MLPVRRVFSCQNNNQHFCSWKWFPGVNSKSFYHISLWLLQYERRFYHSLLCNLWFDGCSTAALGSYVVLAPAQFCSKSRIYTFQKNCDTSGPADHLHDPKWWTQLAEINTWVRLQSQRWGLETWEIWLYKHLTWLESKNEELVNSQNNKNWKGGMQQGLRNHLL